MTAPSFQRARTRRHLATAVAIAAGLTVAPAASAVDGVLLASTPPQVNAVANAEGEMVSAQCTPGAWLQIPAAKAVVPLITYSWLANGLTVGGATTSVYRIAPGDTGKSLTCVTGAVLEVGSAGDVTTYRGSAFSLPLLVVQPPRPAPPTTVTRRLGAATLVMRRATTRSVGRSGRVPIASRVTCSASCRITVAGTMRLGRTTFRSVLRRSVAGRAQALTIVLPRAARTALSRAGRGRLKVVITVRAAGGRASTLRQTLALRWA